MTIQEEIHGLGVRARAAAAKMRSATTDEKNAALEAIACALEEMKDKIVRSVNIPLLVDQFMYEWEA
jgi:gamma-glutamyl phosphate reductase